MDSSQKPLVSVIVPIFNVELYLRKCLESLASQTYKRIEVIMVIDAASDPSVGICSEFAQKDARFRLVDRKNAGLSDARNAGLDVAKGDLYAFVDGDDWVDARMYEKLVSALIEYDADIVQCGCCRTKSEIFNSTRGQSGKPILYAGSDIIPKLFETGHAQPDVALTVVWNKIYIKGMFLDFRFPDGKMFEDQFVTYINFFRAKRVVILSEILYYYRLNLNSQSQSYRTAFHHEIDAHEEFITFMRKNRKHDFVNICLSKLFPLIVYHYYATNFFLGDTRAMKHLKRIICKHLFAYFQIKQISIIDKLGMILFLVSPLLFLYVHKRLLKTRYFYCWAGLGQFTVDEKFKYFKFT
jgi:glycosyltransferase involved in cell wall biosynthesis